MSMQDFLFSLKLTIKILTGTHWVFCDQRWWTLEPQVSLLFTLLQPHRSRWWGLKVNAGESWGVDSGLTSETLQHTESDLNVPDSSLFLIGKLVRIEHAYLQKCGGFKVSFLLVVAKYPDRSISRKKGPLGAHSWRPSPWEEREHRVIHPSQPAEKGPVHAPQVPPSLFIQSRIPGKEWCHPQQTCPQPQLLQLDHFPTCPEDHHLPVDC